jgi:hypothetical protein
MQSDERPKRDSKRTETSFDEEMKKLARQRDRAYEEACQRARKKLQAEERKSASEKVWH